MYFVIIFFKSKAKATFDGVDNLKVENERMRECENGNEEERKGSSFSSWDHLNFKQ